MSRSYVRFTVNQRLQHLFMFVPFIILVLTGFPLKFPDSAFWEKSMYIFGGIDKARVVHRVAAAVMILDFGFHVLYILLNLLGGKTTIKDMVLLPRWQDAKDLVQNMRFFTFQSEVRPRFGKYSYIEKFDYWAVFWGMFIMAGSGLVLWFPLQATLLLPGVIIQIAYVAHSDEALLAFLAIIIWHFYNVHFNPRVWPANKVWYRGTLTEEEMEHEHPVELERLKALEQVEQEEEE